PRPRRADRRGRAAADERARYRRGRLLCPIRCQRRAVRGSRAPARGAATPREHRVLTMSREYSKVQTSGVRARAIALIVAAAGAVGACDGGGSIGPPPGDDWSWSDLGGPEA